MDDRILNKRLEHQFPAGPVIIIGIKINSIIKDTVQPFSLQEEVLLDPGYLLKHIYILVFLVKSISENVREFFQQNGNLKMTCICCSSTF